MIKRNLIPRLIQLAERLEHLFPQIRAFTMDYNNRAQTQKIKDLLAGT